MKCYVWPATRAEARRWALSEALVKTVYAFLPHTLFSPSTLPSISLGKPTVHTCGSNQKIAAKYTEYKDSVLNGRMCTRSEFLQITVDTRRTAVSCGFTERSPLGFCACEFVGTKRLEMRFGDYEFGLDCMPHKQ